MATEEKKAVDLGLLEEDDEFEEFPVENGRLTTRIILMSMYGKTIGMMTLSKTTFLFSYDRN